MNRLLLSFAGSLIFNCLYTQSIISSPEQVVKRVADNVIAITPFTLVNKKTNEVFTSTKGLVPSYMQQAAKLQKVLFLLELNNGIATCAPCKRKVL